MSVLLENGAGQGGRDEKGVGSKLGEESDLDMRHMLGP